MEMIRDTTYFQIYADIYGLHKMFYGIDQNSDRWADFCYQADQIADKYRGHPEAEFVKKMILAIGEELSRAAKKGASF